MSKMKDAICGIIGMIFAAALFFLSVQIGMKESTTIGADFVPKIVAVLLFILFAILTGRGIKEAKNAKEKPAEYKNNFLGAVFMFAAMILYAVLLKPVGFIITSCLFLYGALILMSRKEQIHYIKFLVITLVTVLCINFVFMEIFGIRIPQGIL